MKKAKKSKKHKEVSREDKEAMFLEQSELLNALDSGATTKITINNRKPNKADFEQTILIPMAEDGLDKSLLFERISNVKLKQLEYQKQTDEKLEQILEYISEHEESSQKVMRSV